MEGSENIQANDRIPLGKSELQISELGVGAWAWGDRRVWGYGRSHREEDVAAAFRVSREAGVNWVDTAEVYGLGTSERLVGRFIREVDPGERMLVATKYFPLPWRWSKKALTAALQGSLERLQLEQVDLYQVHFPRPNFQVANFAQGLIEVLERGLARAAGVSNYNTEQMLHTQEILEKRNLSLSANQVPYSLLNRRVEKNGLLEACQKQGITLIAYSPLEMGLLTGKYSPANPPPGTRSRSYSRKLLAEMQPLVEKLREIGQAHAGKTPAQVALNWTICKGSVPIPGAKNARQAADNAGALGWRLDASEVAELDVLSDRVINGT